MSIDHQTDRGDATDDNEVGNPYAAPAADERAEAAGGRSHWKSAAWLWVPTLYFAEGVPNQMVALLAGDMYTLLGVASDRMAFYTSWLYLPWVIKPLWSPLVDVLSTQRRWVIGTQVAITLGLFGVAAALVSEQFFFPSLFFLAFVAFASATHDIAADGFYLSGLSEKQQAWFLGIRSTFYRGAMFFVSAVLLALAGQLSGTLPKDRAWAITFGFAAAVFGLLTAYHAWAMPPQKPSASAGAATKRALGDEIVETIRTFFQRDGVVTGLSFLLLFRFAEAQLGKFARPFMFASVADGGLEITEQQVALIYGGFGLGMLTLGGILGGVVIARDGLRRWLLPMAAAINAPNAAYLLLAVAQPQELWVVGLAVSVEMFGYGFGFAAYLMYMIHLSRGPHETAHYALCTGVMALGMMLPGMLSGGVQKALGYEGFFVYILLATIPSFAVTLLAWRRLPKDA